MPKNILIMFLLIKFIFIWWKHNSIDEDITYIGERENVCWYRTWNTDDDDDDRNDESTFLSTDHDEQPRDWLNDKSSL